MKILITGATGFVGRELAVQLFKAGHSLTLVSRSKKKLQETLPLPVEFIEHDLIQGAIPQRKLQEIEAVVHLAGEGVADGRWSEERKKAILDSRSKGTANLIASFSQLPKIFISASAIGYYGSRGDEILSEDSKPGGDFLAEVCKRWEEQTLSQPSGVRKVCFRFGAVLGRAQGILGNMAPVFASYLGGPIGDGSDWLSWVHVQDVVRAIEFALEKETVSGVYNLVAPTPVVNRDFTKGLAGALGVVAPFPVPKFLLRTLLGELSTLVLASQRVSSSKLEQAGFSFQFPTLAQGLADLYPGKYYELFRSVQWIDSPRANVFPFFADASNLDRITPPWLGFKTLHSTTKSIQEGTQFLYALKIHGIPVRWRSEIQNWKPPLQFRDIQLKGPYSEWRHDHIFSEARGGTLMEDQVLYRLPLHAIARLVAGAWVRSDVTKIFAYRTRIIFNKFPKASDPVKN